MKRKIFPSSSEDKIMTNFLRRSMENKRVSVVRMDEKKFISRDKVFQRNNCDSEWVVEGENASH